LFFFLFFFLLLLLIHIDPFITLNRSADDDRPFSNPQIESANGGKWRQMEANGNEEKRLTAMKEPALNLIVASVDYVSWC